MIKQTVHAENFDGDEVSATFWFNLNRKEVVDFMISEAGHDSVFAKTLVVDGIQAYQFFVRLIDKAYGERDRDGVHFRKSEQALSNFKESVFYENCVFDLVNDPKRAARFFNGVMPKKMIEEARKSNPEAFAGLD